MRAWSGAAGAALAGIGVMHLGWTRASWPMASREHLARDVVGLPDGRLPNWFTIASVAVGTGLCAAGGLVAASGGAIQTPVPDRWARRGAAATGAVLLGRAAQGFVESAFDLGDYPPGFRRKNARIYSPLCLVLGSSAVAAARRR